MIIVHALFASPFLALVLCLGFNLPDHRGGPGLIHTFVHQYAGVIFILTLVFLILDAVIYTFLNRSGPNWRSAAWLIGLPVFFLGMGAVILFGDLGIFLFEIGKSFMELFKQT